MDKIDLRRKKVPRYRRFHPFSWGSDEVEIDQHIAALEEMKSIHGSTHLQLAVPANSPISVADLEFYCKNYEDESDHDFLARIGIDTPEARQAVFQAIATVESNLPKAPFKPYEAHLELDF